jgi:hypothetical protein
MGLDIRTPIGLMFACFGVLLVGYGLMTNGSDVYRRSLGVNVNLEWGAVLLVFGAAMLYFGRKGRPRT